MKRPFRHIRWDRVSATIVLAVLLFGLRPATAEIGPGNCRLALDQLYRSFIAPSELRQSDDLISTFIQSEDYRLCEGRRPSEEAGFDDFLAYVAVQRMVGLEPDTIGINPLWNAFLQADGRLDDRAVDVDLVQDLALRADALVDVDRVILWATISESVIAVDQEIYAGLLDAAIRWGHSSAIEEQITHEHYTQNPQRYAEFQLREMIGRSLRGSVELRLAALLVETANSIGFLTREQRDGLQETALALAEESIRLGNIYGHVVIYLMDEENERACDLIDAGLAGFIVLSDQVRVFHCEETRTLWPQHRHYLEMFAAWYGTLNEWRDLSD